MRSLQILYIFVLRAGKMITFEPKVDISPPHTTKLPYVEFANFAGKVILAAFHNISRANVVF